MKAIQDNDDDQQHGARGHSEHAYHGHVCPSRNDARLLCVAGRIVMRHVARLAKSVPPFALSLSQLPGKNHHTTRVARRHA